MPSLHSRRLQFATQKRSLKEICQIVKQQLSLDSQATVVVKNLPANAGDLRHVDLILVLGKSSGEGNGNPIQYSCMKNPMDGGVWQDTVHGVTKSQTRLSDFTFHTHQRHLEDSNKPCVHQAPKTPQQLSQNCV